MTSHRNRVTTLLALLTVALTVTVGSAADAAVPAGGSAVDCIDLEITSRDAVLQDPHEPFGVLTPCPGVRPGAIVWTEPGSGCTLNFVFRGTSVDADEEPVDEGLFIGTAGHCIFDSESGPDGEVWPEGEGPWAEDDARTVFGEFAYAIDTGPWDFALIRIHDEHEEDVEPGLCHFGGPTGLSSAPPQGEQVHHFGQGLVYGDVVPGRTGAKFDGLRSSPQTEFVSAAIFGDSGSPVIDHDGGAIGVLVALSLVPPGTTIASDLGAHLERAEEATGIDFEVVTAELH